MAGRTRGHQFVSDSRTVAELVVELTARLQQVQQQRHGLLEESCRTARRWRSTPAGGLSTRRGNTFGLWPWAQTCGDPVEAWPPTPDVGAHCPGSSQ